MPSLANTLRRCHSTVRAPMNSCAPISGLVRRPGPAGRSPPPGGQFGARVLVAPAHLLAGGLEFPPCTLGESLDAHGCERLKRGPQLIAGIDTPMLAAQPLAIAQAGTGQMRRHPGLAQQVDGLAVQVFGGAPLGNQRARPCRGATGPVAGARAASPTAGRPPRGPRSAGRRVPRLPPAHTAPTARWRPRRRRRRCARRRRRARSRRGRCEHGLGVVRVGQRRALAPGGAPRTIASVSSAAVGASPRHAASRSGT